MRNKAQIIDKLKNAVICILAVCAILLMLLAVDVSPQLLFSGISGGAASSQGSAPEESIAGVISSVPYTFLLTNKTSSDSGSAHYAAKYNYQAKAQIISQFSVTLGEALGSANSPEKITEAQWREALSSTGIFIDYVYPQPLSLIAETLGTSVSSYIANAFSSRICIAMQNRTLEGSDGETQAVVCLFYIDENTGDCYRLYTALNAASFYQRFSDIDLPVGSFAFEANEALAKIDPYFVYTQEAISFDTAQSSSVALTFDESAMLLDAFSMNERSNFYPDNAAIVYADGSKNLRIELNGALIFTASGSDSIEIAYEGEELKLFDCLRSCSSIIASTISLQKGDAEIVLTGVQKGTAKDSYTLTFEYYVNGIPVKLTGTGWCAKFQISSGRIVRAEFLYRNYVSYPSTAGGISTIEVLPEEQAAIIAANASGSPLLVYADGFGVLSLSWTGIM